MKNYLLGLGALAVTIGVCVLVIHYEAQETRDNMRQIAHDELTSFVEEGLSDAVKAVQKKLPPGSASPDANEPLQKTDGAGGLLSGMLDKLNLPTGSGDSAPGILTRPTRPADAIDGLVGTMHDAIDSAEKAVQPYVQLSISQEREQGRKFHAQILREYTVVKDTALYDRIDELAAPLLRARKRKGIDYTFTVIKTDPEDLNAFSIVGGYIYLHSAIVDFCKTDHELQFVMGHEMGHVDLGHCAHGQGIADALGRFANDIVSSTHAMLATSFSQSQEYEADEYGFRALLAAGRTREQALEFPRRFARYFRLRGQDQPTKKKTDHSVLGTLIEDYNSHFRTHPYNDDRVKRLEALKIESPPES